jgi:ankyrin repeat protein
MAPAAEAFFAAIAKGDVGAVEAAVRMDPALLASRNAGGITPVTWACYTRQGSVLSALRRAGAPLDLFDAVSAGDEDRALELLHADPSLARAWSGDGFTALHLAAFFSRTATAIRLLALGADTAAPSRNAMLVAPLHSAAAAHCLEVCRLLLAAGAPADAKQQGGHTALMEAGNSGDEPLAELLLANGADPAVTNDEGHTAADLAREHGHLELAELLRP